MVFGHQNLISNWLTYLVHAKSTDELISFGFSDRSVRSLVSAKCSANRWVQMKNDFTFWLLWSQSTFRTQQKSQRKINPKSKMTLWLQISALKQRQQYLLKRSHLLTHQAVNYRRLSNVWITWTVNTHAQTASHHGSVDKITECYSLLFFTAALKQNCHSLIYFQLSDR